MTFDAKSRTSGGRMHTAPIRACTGTNFNISQSFKVSCEHICNRADAATIPRVKLREASARFESQNVKSFHRIGDMILASTERMPLTPDQFVSSDREASSHELQASLNSLEKDARLEHEGLCYGRVIWVARALSSRENISARTCGVHLSQRARLLA